MPDGGGLAITLYGIDGPRRTPRPTERSPDEAVVRFEAVRPGSVEVRERWVEESRARVATVEDAPVVVVIPEAQPVTPPEELVRSFADLRAELRAELRDDVRADLRAEVRAALAQIPPLIQTLRETFAEEIEALRSLNHEEAKRMRSSSGEEQVRTRVATTGELDRIRGAIEAGVDRLCAVIEGELDRMWSANDTELERIRSTGTERLEEVHDLLTSELRRVRAAAPHTIASPTRRRLRRSRPAEL